MSEFAKLILEADTSGLERGEAGLDSLVATGAKAEASVGKALASIGSEAAKVGTTVGAAFNKVAVESAKMSTATLSSVNAITGVSREFKSAEASANAFTAALNAQQNSFNALRMSIDPVYANSMRYQQAVEQIDLALKQGVATQAQHARMMKMAEAQFLATGAAAQRYGHQTNAAAGSMGNLVAQGNDIMVMLAAGQNPLILAMQQGTQISQVLTQVASSGKSVGASLKAAFLGMLSPISLATIAVIAIGAAAIQMAMSFFSSEEKAKTLKEVFQDLSSAAQEYVSAVNAASVSTDGLKAKYGSLTTQARLALQAMKDIRLQEVFNAMSVAIDKATADLTELKIVAAGKGFVGTVSQIKAEFGLAADEAARLKSALSDLQGASSLRDQALAAAEVQYSLEAAYGSVSNMPPALQSVYSSMADIVLQAGEVQGATESSTFSIWDFVDGANAAANALAGAASWADALAGKAQLAASSIWSALGAMGAHAKAVGGGRGMTPGGVIGGQFSQEDPNGFYRQLQDAEVAAKKLEEQMKRTGKSGGGAGKKLTEAQKEAKKALEDSQKAAEKLQEELDRPMIGAIEGVSDAWGDFVSRGFKDFDSFVDSVKDSFTGMISEMVSYAMRNRIMMSMGFSTTASDAGSLAAGVSPTAGGGGLLSTLLGFGGASGGGGGLMGILGSFGSGASGLISSLFGAGGGIGAAGTYLSTVLSGATASLGGLAAAAGAIMPIIAGLGAVLSFFKTKTKVLDAGLKINVKNMGAFVQTFQTLEKKKFWGLSKKTSVEMANAAKALRDPIVNTIVKIQKSVRKNAEAIGVDAKVFEKFRRTIWFSTKDLTKQEIAEKLQNQLKGMGNAFAKRVPGLMSMKKAGEDAMSTLARVAMQLKVVNKTFKLLGFDLFDVSIKGAKASNQIVKIFGNIQNFLQATSYYFDNFYTNEEKILALSQQLKVGFNKAGVGASLPKSIEEYRTLVDNLEAAGRTQAAAKLIKLAPLFVQLQEALGGTADAVQDLKEQLDPNDFRTMLEYRRAQGAIDYPAKGSPAAQAQAANDEEIDQGSAGADSDRTKNSDLLAVLLQIAKHVGFSQKILDQWNNDGMPKTRTSTSN
jgi:hypothetical protein